MWNSREAHDQGQERHQAPIFLLTKSLKRRVSDRHLGRGRESWAASIRVLHLPSRFSWAHTDKSVLPLTCPVYQQAIRLIQAFGKSHPWCVSETLRASKTKTSHHHLHDRYLAELDTRQKRDKRVLKWEDQSDTNAQVQQLRWVPRVHLSLAAQIQLQAFEAHCDGGCLHLSQILGHNLCWSVNDCWDSVAWRRAVVIGSRLSSKWRRRTAILHTVPQRCLCRNQRQASRQQRPV